MAWEWAGRGCWMAGGGGGEVVVEFRRLISEALGRIREESGLASMWWLVKVEVWELDSSLGGHSLGVSVSLVADDRGWRETIPIDPDGIGDIDATVVLGKAFNEVLKCFHDDLRQRDTGVGVVS
jgi:hypothetical protein